MGRIKGIPNKKIKGNEIEIIGNIAYVLIRSKTHGNQTCIVDSEDVKKISSKTWFLLKRSNALYAYSREGSMHGFLLGIKGKGFVPDHIDGDGLNNMKCNLRTATTKENSRNKKRNSNSSSKYKGVVISIIARIYVNGSFIFLGSFKTQEDAAKAYNEAAIKYFGEFARLNVVD